jgi:hypothetical protein
MLLLFLFANDSFAFSLSFVASRPVSQARSQMVLFKPVASKVTFGVLTHSQMTRVWEFEWGLLYNMHRGFLPLPGMLSAVEVTGHLIPLLLRVYPYRVLSFGFGSYVFIGTQGVGVTVPWTDYGALASFALLLPIVRKVRILLDATFSHSVLSVSARNAQLMDVVLMAGCNIVL